MRLQDLQVHHLAKDSGIGPDEVQLMSSQLRGAFRLETCQRWIWINSGESTDSLRGQDAYLFLLRLLCGLESQILGETDIFGQFKTAWQDFKTSSGSMPSLARELGPWIQRLFEDAKEIRSRHIQNLGGVSYGSLVRRILREQFGQAGSVLIVGAGQLAQSISPYLLQYDLTLTNRDSRRLEIFYSDLIKSSGVGGSVSVTSEFLKLSELKSVQAVIFCVPMVNFSAELSEFLQSRYVIHLGARRDELGSHVHAQFLGLDNVFSLHNSLGNIRSVQLARAEKACVERSILRSLGTSLCIPHGWEDLANFA